MDRTRAIDALNCILRTLYRSLPLYLHGKRLWSPRGRDEIGLTIDRIAADYRSYIERAAELIYRWDGRLEPGQFPLDFTSMHDLSLEYLFKDLVERQRSDVGAIEECVGRLGDCPEARPLAEEILGNARGHLDNLEELAEGDRPAIVRAKP